MCWLVFCERFDVGKTKAATHVFAGWLVGGERNDAGTSNIDWASHSFLVLRCASSHVHCDERCTFDEVGWSEPAGMRRKKRVFQCNGLALMQLSHTGY